MDSVRFSFMALFDVLVTKVFFKILLYLVLNGKFRILQVVAVDVDLCVWVIRK